MTIVIDRQNSLTAVVQGAIAWGSGKVELRSMRSPCHFGLSTMNPVDFPLPISSCLGPAFQNDPIYWLVKKGDRLRTDVMIQGVGTLIHREGESYMKVINIFSSGSNDPPTRVSERGPSKISTLAIDISSINLSDCERGEGGGPCAWKVNYMITARLGDTDGTIHFDIYWDKTHLVNWKFKPGFIRY
ncbi:actin-like ATPase domain-containing protein [Penicillium malachiteum]|uniref:Actin-like ATPase domain-containing protein n=1 Tax=Penicillium malachiteum TaxID=1324776 RepID=A0AAD6MZQ0_9EURO|nr:actin-like ATPase domain-containing protein [Penicillium malachiteum]